jgi:L-aspartate oxidase
LFSVPEKINMKVRCDFLVIGSGIAGLSFALKAAAHGRVCVITKTVLDDCNTNYAQGGIATVMYEPDNFEKHVRDTMVAGAGYCNEEVVRLVVSEAPARIKELIDMGVDFDKMADGRLDMAMEGGHSEHRILHHKDSTGAAIEKVLIQRVRENKNIEIFENHFAIDLLTQHNLGEYVTREWKDIRCYGAYVADLNSNKVKTVLSRVTVMATGGCGNIYLTTTNPEVATGDGLAMVHRANGVIENMEFIQFHPTSLYNPNVRPSFLITEALRGFGGELRNSEGEKFMARYHVRGSLAPRDVVARAIDNEMKIRGDDFVYLDCTHLNAEELKSHFPHIYEKCLVENIDITRQMIPVVPAAHYSCGGVRVDKDGRSSIDRLYAIGEVSSTGLHGANRLASNSLIEAAVFAHRAAEDACKRVGDLSFEENIPLWNYHGTTNLEEMVLVTQNYKEMQMIMSNYVGIVRSDLRLARAKTRLEIIYRETEDLYKRSTISRKLIELRNLIAAGYLVIKMAKNRKESLGLHYSIDYPARPGSEF